jgi:hypothetical protein
MLGLMNPMFGDDELSRAQFHEVLISWRSNRDDPDYLRRVESCARELILEAVKENRQVYLEDSHPTAFDRALVDLARAVEDWEHFTGDGCLADDPPSLPLAGIVILKPKAMPPTARFTYESACDGLGVEPRIEGWAVWNVWDERRKHRHALILSDFNVTQALLRNWAAGIAVQPSQPLRHHIAQRVEGWVRPMIQFPRLTQDASLQGRP